jgi:hypothetical protein
VRTMSLPWWYFPISSVKETHVFQKVEGDG